MSMNTTVVTLLHEDLLKRILSNYGVNSEIASAVLEEVKKEVLITNIERYYQNVRVNLSHILQIAADTVKDKNIYLLHSLLMAKRHSEICLLAEIITSYRTITLPTYDLSKPLDEFFAELGKEIHRTLKINESYEFSFEQYLEMLPLVNLYNISQKAIDYACCYGDSPDLIRCKVKAVRKVGIAPREEELISELYKATRKILLKNKK